MILAAPSTKSKGRSHVAERVLSPAVTAAIAGHKMTGFDINDADVDMLDAHERGEFTVEEFIARVKATNAGR